MYKNVFLGGTFDLLHQGHKSIIQHASTISKKVVLGITSDSYVAINKPNLSIESFQKRKNILEEFLKNKKIHNITIISIDSALEPAASDPMLDAIVVSENTKSGAQNINEKRKKRKLPLLHIITIPMVFSRDGEEISSSRIRKGAINREGVVFVDPKWLHMSFKLPFHIRKKLKTPGGKLFRNYKDFLFHYKKNADRIISVGDVCTKLLNDEKWNHPISVIDLIVERKKTYSRISELGFLGKERIINITNPAGTINAQIFNVPKQIFSINKQRTVIKVIGEEDLVVLPMILQAPLGWVIVYGQPHQGIVCVEVDEQNKEKAHVIITAMKKL